MDQYMIFGEDDSVVVVCLFSFFLSVLKCNIYTVAYCACDLDI